MSTAVAQATQPSHPYALSGQEIRQLMRRHGKTISGLAAAFKLTQKRVREVRACGVTGFNAESWHFLITGAWPDVTPIKSV